MCGRASDVKALGMTSHLEVALPGVTVSVMSASVPCCFLLVTKPFDFRGHPGQIPSGGDFLLRNIFFD